MGSIVVAGTTYTSDQRIKTDIQEKNNNLSMIQQLTVKTFRFREKVLNSFKKTTGFIAQDVEKVYPDAVRKETRFVPNILALAQKVNSQKKNKLIIQMEKPHEFKIADRIRLIDQSNKTEKTQTCEVTSIPTPTQFIVKNCFEEVPKKLFVYGKEVQDFLILDYNQIFSMSIGAIQELKQEKDQEIADLKKTIDLLKTELQSIKQDFKNSQYH